MPAVIQKAEVKVKELLSGEATGHDWYHTKQVRDMALRIVDKEGGDKELIELVALVHEVGDRKFYPKKEDGEAATLKLLQECDVSEDTQKKVLSAVQAISFSGGRIPDTLEGKIVQDSDRLYAIGAIGIARTFAYGGNKGNLIYDPTRPPMVHETLQSYDAAPTINHFYEKLLLLRDKMNTDTGRIIAKSRHAFMEDFLKHFFDEWETRD